MILKNNRWHDDNNNSWSADVETEESAERKSRTLIGCVSCENCENFKSNPDCYFKNNIGSRNVGIKAYWLIGQPAQIITGCFRGTLDEFEKAVAKKHGDNEHARAYKKYIEQVRSLMI